MEDYHQRAYQYTFSIIIPVFNEQSSINTLIEHLYRLSTGEPLEIIVVDGHPRHTTINVISYKKVIALTSLPGRALQMNLGAASARGEILIFLHADTYLPENGLTRIREVLNDKTVVGGAFDLGIRSDKRIFKLIASVSSLRSRLTRIPYGDQVIFIRKDYFNAMGGYRTIPLMEDVELMQRIKKRGDTICIIKEKALTSPRRWEREGIIYCTLRNWFLVSLYLLGISPNRLTKFYKKV